MAKNPNDPALFFHPDYRRKLSQEEEKRLAELKAKTETEMVKPEMDELNALKKLESMAFNGGNLHSLYNKKMRTYEQGCYDDGKYLFLSPNFCNQEKKAAVQRKWVATWDQKGTPVWVCTTCLSVYPRKEK